MPLTLPTFVAGQRAKASSLQSLADAIADMSGVVIKTSDQSVTNSTTLANDSELLFSVAANAEYQVEAFLIYQATTAGDGKIAWTAPAGSEFKWASGGIDPAATAAQVVAPHNIEYRILSDYAITGGTAAGNSVVIRPQGKLVTAGTAGTFRMQFAQFTAAPATAMTIKADSYLNYRRTA